MPSRHRNSTPSAPSLTLSSVLLAPAAHGLTGSWDEIVLMGVALAIFGGYVLWMRGAFGKKRDGDAEDADAPEDDGLDDETEPDRPKRGER